MAVLTGRAVAETARTVELTHSAVAAIALRPWDVALRRIGVTNSAARSGLIRRGVYGAIRVAGPLVGAAAGHAAAARVDPAAPALSRTARGGRLQAALNGAVGDALEATASPLSVRMSLRRNNHDLPCDRAALAEAYPDASPTVVVFVHGLCHDENAWLPPGEDGSDAAARSYGERLAADTDATSLHVRYNTGRHVSENGESLSRLLHALHDAWPVPMTSLVLVGHSMGGLVIRSACLDGRRSSLAWLDRTRLIVTIGTPHTGAPLERVAAAAARRLVTFDLTRGLARVFHARSSGIKDLRHGYIDGTEWSDCDQDACSQDHRLPRSPLDSVPHLVIASTVTADPDHPVGRAIGDLLVLPDSGLGRVGEGRAIQFGDDSSTVLGGLTHLGLLHDTAVYEEIRTRLMALVVPVASGPGTPART